MVFLIESNEQPICPKCFMSLNPYNHKMRHRKLPGGEKQWLLIPRYKCQCHLDKVFYDENSISYAVMH